MPDLNPYQSPQSELRSKAWLHVPRKRVARSIRLLNLLQPVFVVAIAACFMFGAEPGHWTWRFLRSLLLGLAVNSLLLGFLAFLNRVWMTLAIAIVMLSISGILLYAMVQVQRWK